MSWWRKITRILWKTVLFSVLFLLSFTVIAFIGFQTETFQTWAAQKLTKYLSAELGTVITIDKVEISFVKNVTLQGVFVSDKHKDTLIYGKNI
ncbi:MAG: hypothetical protein JNM51_03025, partial [Bacteroidia bacterium]|nr:hypothetical protein [Bacteroidia bacterium]